MQPTDPTPEEIEAMCAEIRKGWSEQERQSRMETVRPKSRHPPAPPLEAIEARREVQRLLAEGYSREAIRAVFGDRVV